MADFVPFYWQCTKRITQLCSS